jgi:hypothetical protein
MAAAALAAQPPASPARGRRSVLSTGANEARDQTTVVKPTTASVLGHHRRRRPGEVRWRMRASRCPVVGRGVWPRLRAGEVGGADQGYGGPRRRAKWETGGVPSRGGWCHSRGVRRQPEESPVAARGESSGGQGRATAMMLH